MDKQEQAFILKNLIARQKNRLDEDLRSKLLFLMREHKGVYQKKMKELELLFRISENLLFLQQYHRALIYTILLERKIDWLQDHADQDFEGIRQNM